MIQHWVALDKARDADCRVRRVQHRLAGLVIVRVWLVRVSVLLCVAVGVGRQPAMVQVLGAPADIGLDVAQRARLWQQKRTVRVHRVSWHDQIGAVVQQRRRCGRGLPHIVVWADEREPAGRAQLPPVRVSRRRPLDAVSVHLAGRGSERDWIAALQTSRSPIFLNGKLL